MKELMSGIRKVIKKKQTPTATDAHVHSGSDAKLDPYMLAVVSRKADKVWI